LKTGYEDGRCMKLALDEYCSKIGFTRDEEMLLILILGK
jgi:hypothetical protein